MSNAPCPFCDKKEKDYFIETKSFAAIYNISPILPGHSLIIPKKHYESVLELSDNDFQEFFQLARMTTKFLNNEFLTDAFDWAIQEKAAAGQSVPHLHLHIVPRRIGDLPNPGDWYQELTRQPNGDIDTHGRFRLTDGQLNEITQLLKLNYQQANVKFS